MDKWKKIYFSRNFLSMINQMDSNIITKSRVVPIKLMTNQIYHKYIELIIDFMIIFYYTSDTRIN